MMKIDKLKIRLLKQGWMTTSGSSLLRVMQNFNTPTLDLIVRESLQNSLDAALNKNNKGEVRVQFLYDKFDIDKLSYKIEGIGEKLNNINCENNYLAIIDSNTKGLTGHLNGIFKNNDNEENLGKLVFQIMKPQQEEGSGGSWGIGKTVYYRLGIGLVIYYSRVYVDGNYQNRLVAALVEDEKNTNGILNNYGDDNLGAAFFGEEIEDGINNLSAVTDDYFITDFLSAFNIKPFKENETGTAIIIPFIDEKKTLNNNINEEDDYKTWWYDSITDYLYVSIMRWYFPRLSSGYCFGPKLVAYVNDEQVIFDDNVKLFDILRKMYSCSFNLNDEFTTVEITRTNNMKTNVLGWFTYSKFSKKDIANTIPSPYMYSGVKNISDDYNTPLIAFCRKPGMIVNYNNDLNIRTKKDEYIVGIFVLNSNNEIIYNSEKISLEEYIRKGEKSDHAMWFDYSIFKEGKRINIVNQINTKIKKKLEEEYGNTDESTGSGEIVTSLANYFGQKYMPGINFGDDSRMTKDKKTPPKKELVIKSGKNSVHFNKTINFSTYTHAYYSIIIGDKVNTINIDSFINTIGGTYNSNKWELNNLAYPLDIERIAFKCRMVNGIKVDKEKVIIDKEGIFENYKVKIKSSLHGKGYGIQLSSIDNNYSMIFDVSIEFSSVDKSYQAGFTFDFVEDS